MEPKGILAFDLDGTLTKRNTEIILPEGLVPLLKDLSKLGYFSVPVTGKPAPYALRIIHKNGLSQNGVVAENAGVYIKPNEEQINIYGHNKESMELLRKAIGLDIGVSGVTTIMFGDKTTEVVIDPEDVSILTIFTDASFVKHRWVFNPTMSTAEVYSGLQKLIQEYDLGEKVQLLPPFPDGGIQVIRRSRNGLAIDKSSLPEALYLMYGVQHISIAMFGDGHNDIPAMTPAHVLPLTFQNAEQVVKDFVKKRDGFVSTFDAPDGLGVVQGLLWLCEQGQFFGEDGARVKQFILHAFPALQ